MQPRHNQNQQQQQQPQQQAPACTVCRRNDHTEDGHPLYLQINRQIYLRNRLPPPLPEIYNDIVNPQRQQRHPRGRDPLPEYSAAYDRHDSPSTSASFNSTRRAPQNCFAPASQMQQEQLALTFEEPHSFYNAPSQIYPALQQAQHSHFAAPQYFNDVHYHHRNSLPANHYNDLDDPHSIYVSQHTLALLPSPNGSLQRPPRNHNPHHPILTLPSPRSYPTVTATTSTAAATTSTANTTTSTSTSSTAATSVPTPTATTTTTNDKKQKRVDRHHRERSSSSSSSAAATGASTSSTSSSSSSSSDEEPQRKKRSRSNSKSKSRSRTRSRSKSRSKTTPKRKPNCKQNTKQPKSNSNSRSRTRSVSNSRARTRSVSKNRPTTSVSHTRANSRSNSQQQNENQNQNRNETQSQDDKFLPVSPDREATPPPSPSHKKSK